MSWCAFNDFNIKNTSNLKFYRYIAATFVKLRGFVFSVTRDMSCSNYKPF
jgi:hypothetical protein